jgi:hypothetical protein
MSVKADRVDQFMLHCMSLLLTQSGHWTMTTEGPPRGAPCNFSFAPGAVLVPTAYAFVSLILIIG